MSTSIVHVWADEGEQGRVPVNPSTRHDLLESIWQIIDHSSLTNMAFAFLRIFKWKLAIANQSFVRGFKVLWLLVAFTCVLYCQANPDNGIQRDMNKMTAHCPSSNCSWSGSFKDFQVGKDPLWKEELDKIIKLHSKFCTYQLFFVFQKHYASCELQAMQQYETEQQQASFNHLLLSAK